jgi:hypothetical protein
MKRIVSILLCAVLLLGTLSLFGCDEVEAAYVEIDVENYGKIVVYVDPTYAPITVKSKQPDNLAVQIPPARVNLEYPSPLTP